MSDASTPRVLNPCESLPYFTGEQIVDGRDDDFATLPMRTYRDTDLIQKGSVVGGQIVVDVRSAWSERGVHWFFTVHNDANRAVVLPKIGDPLWYGDGIELFLKGDTLLTGTYDGEQKDPGALQIIAVPDLTGVPRSGMYALAGEADFGPLPAASVAATPTEDGHGYNLELFIRWDLITPPPHTAPAAGSSIALDFAVDYHSRSAANPDDVGYQLLLHRAAVDEPNEDCMLGDVIPSCDDRTWCGSRLE